MSDNYSTIQQHQPLRVPQGWGKQEKALIVQLDEVFDDIYRRFGRLRIEDMGKAFRKSFSDAKGNIAELTLDVSGLTTRIGDAEGNIGNLQVSATRLFAVVQNQNGDISGITITVDGIDLSGSKYIKLASGTSLVDIEPDKIELSSGGTKVIIDPTQMNMNTSGLVSILGKDNSVIQLLGGTGNAQTIFKADASGVVKAVKISSSEVNASFMEVTDLKVNGNLDANIEIPKIVIGGTQPAAGSGVIWLEPVSTIVTPFSYTQSVADTTMAGWTLSGTLTWKQTCSIGSSIAAEGAKKFKITGNLYKNGTTGDVTTKLSAKVILSDSSTVDLGDVGTFPSGQSLQWNYGFTKEFMYTGTAIASGVTAVSVELTYTVTSGNDQSAYATTTNNVTLQVSGETGTAGNTDECTVHYIA